MQAVRDDEVAAAAAGVAVFRTKLVGFMLSAAMTALAAVLYMQFYMAIDPEAAFGLSQAIQLQLPALLGGLGTAPGPVIGGAHHDLSLRGHQLGVDQARNRGRGHPGLRPDAAGRRAARAEGNSRRGLQERRRGRSR